MNEVQLFTNVIVMNIKCIILRNYLFRKASRAFTNFLFSRKSYFVFIQISSRQLFTNISKKYEKYEKSHKMSNGQSRAMRLSAINYHKRHMTLKWRYLDVVTPFKKTNNNVVVASP